MWHALACYQVSTPRICVVGFKLNYSLMPSDLSHSCFDFISPEFEGVCMVPLSVFLSAGIFVNL